MVEVVVGVVVAAAAVVGVVVAVEVVVGVAVVVVVAVAVGVVVVVAVGVVVVVVMAGEGNRSRRKGRVGSREVVALLRGDNLHATPSLNNSGGLPDVLVDLGADVLHLEVKRQETTRFPLWIAQAEENAGPFRIPGVAWRKSRGRWYALLPLEDLARLLT